MPEPYDIEHVRERYPAIVAKIALAEAVVETQVTFRVVVKNDSFDEMKREVELWLAGKRDQPAFINRLEFVP